jgi:coenzyme F420-reducing hydrogenase beta subunit
MRNRERAVFVDRELSAAGLRRVISRFDTFIACRFHAMISSLCEGVPCVVPAWSHKYREVMDEFGLGSYVIDRKGLSADSLAASALETLSRGADIRKQIGASLPSVKESAMSQLEYTARLLRESGVAVKAGRTARWLYRDIYRERFRGAWIGYCSDEDIRGEAASGGFVSALAIDMLRSGEIDGVIAARTAMKDGEIAFETVLCRTEEEILDCRTSIYSDFNHAGGIIDILKREEGRFAAVALPCQWTWIRKWLATGPSVSGELVLRLGLWCGHATHRRLIEDYLDIKGIERSSMERLWYRKGHWGGAMGILRKDGEVIRIPFRKGYGMLQNLYADCMGRCLSCEDHFAWDSDISFGDSWLTEMKKVPIKHSMAVALTPEGRKAGERIASAGIAYASEIPPLLAVQAQKRSALWHTYGTAGREKVARLFGVRVRGSGRYRARWNDYISSYMMLLSRRAFAGRMRMRLMKAPRPLLFIYMLVQKTFLNF